MPGVHDEHLDRETADDDGGVAAEARHDGETGPRRQEKRSAATP
jgi:hypothetical protein